VDITSAWRQAVVGVTLLRRVAHLGICAVLRLRQPFRQMVAQLQKAGLQQFALICKNLASVWFSVCCKRAEKGLM